MILIHAVREGSDNFALDYLILVTNTKVMKLIDWRIYGILYIVSLVQWPFLWKSSNTRYSTLNRKQNHFTKWKKKPNSTFLGFAKVLPLFSRVLYKSLFGWFVDLSVCWLVFWSVSLSIWPSHNCFNVFNVFQTVPRFFAHFCFTACSSVYLSVCLPDFFWKFRGTQHWSNNLVILCCSCDFRSISKWIPEQCYEWSCENNPRRDQWWALVINR